MDSFHPTPGKPTTATSNSSLNFFVRNREKSIRCSSLHQTFTAPSPEASPSIGLRYVNYSMSDETDESMFPLDSELTDMEDDDTEYISDSTTDLPSAAMARGTRQLSYNENLDQRSFSKTPNKHIEVKNLKDLCSPSHSGRISKSLCPVLRRKSLLPKPKMFQRVASALYEESSPLELEIRSESEFSKMFFEPKKSSSFVSRAASPAMVGPGVPFYSSITGANGNVLAPSGSLKAVENSDVIESSAEDSSNTDNPSTKPSNEMPISPLLSSSVFFKDTEMSTPNSNHSRSRTPSSKKRTRWGEEIIDLSKRRAVSPSIYYDLDKKCSPIHSVMVSPLKIKDTHEVLMNLKL
ncbi:hypothetical protein POMI540_1117 [Schizosaccharomyces pombe]|uniref:Uncharacterized protein C16C6.04 n=1 Tax=Schizosaccharomyces pombe (strain 972 / ATCC 24843) TaxID=284812 RepID=YBD4_SCHPO|nr:uncharacterized protein SPBC16C6.04 [Schizosaccharomyces pombe]O42928.1 RecName: Full=Uncharacterized protein C16C6.04 [Schizosaccharomyces pombe 972h-]CAA16912.1 sequence orphan [Schizosaccharomyces pombe]|eukprot:NP_596802.1 uncharacterized protein SPBC16C6.04 [Schizosaccharomyces pombe]